MDFYKKIIKNKDISGVLNEKEYKCVSLQAITNEAVKENNKERLKDLVEEINGHLSDLRLIKDDKDPKNKEKCEKLIHQYEECLVKILNKKPSDNLLTILNQKMEELQHLSHLAIQERKDEELKKLMERIERNLEIVKEMPEVKDAKSAEKGEVFLKLVDKYEDLLKVINTHISAKRRIVSEPMSAEVFQKFVQANPQEQETPPAKPNKIGLNEVEEKLKLMRQKRLNRLSTFVDQQSKLSEQRSRENSPKNSDNSNKSLENLSKITESVEIETAIKSIQSPEIVKPSPFRPIAREKLVKTSEPKVFLKADEKVIKKLEPKLPTSEFRGENALVAASFKNTTVKSEISGIVNEKQLASTAILTGSSYVKEWPKPSDIKTLGKPLKEEDTKTQNRNSHKTENEGSVGETHASSVRNSFGKGTLTRSFAERQIENAKMQAVSEKPKVQLKQSNSTRTTPPRTPTQIRKIFNSFNACVLGSNTNKSIEDLPTEFNSPFEQELKTVNLKSTGFDYRLESSKEKKDDSFKSNIQEITKKESLKPSDSPPPVPKRRPVPSRDKTDFARNRAFGQNEFDNFPEKVKPLERKTLDVENVVSVEKSWPPDVIEKTASGYHDMVINRTNENITPKTSDATRRLSLDFDAVTVREPRPNFGEQQPTDLLITVKRDSNTIPKESDRYSFTTFRSSTDSLKNTNENSVENPLYGIIIKADGKINKNTHIETTKYGTGEKGFKDLIVNCNSLESLLKTVTRKDLRNVNYVDKIKELNFLLKEVQKNVEITLDIDESTKENKKFSRFFEDISNIENTIKTFKGLKRDPDYLLIDKQLAKYYVEIDQIRPQSPNDRSEKKCLTERLRTANKDLEDQVTRNEEILKSILEEQVKLLGAKYRIA